MAGYVFAIGNTVDPVEVIRECAEKGIYSTIIESVSPASFEGTLADYSSMKPGDNVYFFCKRKYYGVGKLIAVGEDCKYCNYPGASTLNDHGLLAVRGEALMDAGDSTPNYRWLCTFEGDPYIFSEGIDTDEILTYKPNTFKMLRAFWKLSFIKLGEEENQSLREFFLLRHQRELEDPVNVLPTDPTFHEAMKRQDLRRYMIDPKDMLACVANGDRLRHEMALEAAVVYDLANDRCPLLGSWDYVSHQVIASPFKPIDYMDKIDVFAVRHLGGTKIPCKYLVAELKKDQADKETIDQVLKYVDWVCNEYAYGDYEMVEAAIIAHEYSDDVAAYFDQVVQRYYTQGSHPVRNLKWGALKLLKYRYENGEIIYEDETP